MSSGYTLNNSTSNFFSNNDNNSNFTSILKSNSSSYPSNQPSWNFASFDNRQQDDTLTLPPIKTETFQDDSLLNNEPLPSMDSPSLFLPGTPISALRQGQHLLSPAYPGSRLQQLSRRMTPPSPVQSPDYFHLNFSEQDNEYYPPSNQQQLLQERGAGGTRQPEQSSRRLLRPSNLDLEVDLEAFDWDAYLSQPDDPNHPFVSRTSSRASGATRASTFVDLTENDPDMPPTRKRKADAAVSSRPSKSSRTTSKTPKFAPARSVPTDDVDVEVVDLAENESLQQYEAAKAKRQEDLIIQQNQEEATKDIKLVEFECIICMDPPTDLTVTHCGHLFCSECLHSALEAGNGKKCCPVCRSNISTGGPGRKMPRKMGIFPLSMKLMTANKKGKQPSR